MTKPGTTNLPFFFVSAAAMLARVLKALPITPFFTSQLSAIAAVNAVLVITVPFIIGAILSLQLDVIARPIMVPPLFALEPKRIQT